MEANTTRAKPSTKDQGPKIKRVPRWCGVHSSRPVARVWPLLDLLSLLPLRGQRAIFAWAPGSPPTG